MYSTNEVGEILLNKVIVDRDFNSNACKFIEECPMKLRERVT